MADLGNLKTIEELRKEIEQLKNRISLLSQDAERIRKAARTIDLSDSEHAEVSDGGIWIKSSTPDVEDFGEFTWGEIKEALELWINPLPAPVEAPQGLSGEELQRVAEAALQGFPMEHEGHFQALQRIIEQVKTAVNAAAHGEKA